MKNSNRYGSVGSYGSIPPYQGGSGRGPYRRRRPLRTFLKALAVVVVLAIAVPAGFLVAEYIKLQEGAVPIVTEAPTSPATTPELTPGATPDASPTFSDKEGLQRDLRTPIVYVAPKDPDVENILLIGVDRRNTESLKGNSDSMMIVSIDRKNKTMKLLSLLRDIYVDIENGGKTVQGKINASYAYGGPGLVVNTINRTFDLDIQKYVLVDFKSAEAVVTAAGGLEIDVSAAEMTDMNKSISETNAVILPDTPASPLITSPGLQHLNARQVIAYARIRHVDLVEDGKTYAMDFGRTERQKIVLRGLMNQFFSIGLLDKISMLNTGFDMVETNLKLSDAYDLMTFASNQLLHDSSASAIQGYSIPKWGSYTVVTTPTWCFVVDFNKAIPEIQNFIWGRTFAFTPRDPVSP